jgi:hypothetical protein
LAKKDGFPKSPSGVLRLASGPFRFAVGFSIFGELVQNGDHRESFSTQAEHLKCVLNRPKKDNPDLWRKKSV